MCIVARFHPSPGAARPANHTNTLNGRKYILFAGLLDEAHRQGLNAVKTCLVRVPTREQPLAVVSAEVTTDKGSFHGLGFANLGITVPSGMVPEDVLQIAYKLHNEQNLPEGFTLHQNYPNPFNPVT